MKHPLRTLFVAATFLLVGCNSSLDQRAYVRWVEDPDHGLRVQRAVNDYLLKLQYRPTDYVALQRINQNRDVNKTLVFDQVRQEVAPLQYYTFSVQTLEPANDLLRHGTAAEKQRLLYYLSYELQHALHLEEQHQPLPCVLYHFERSYDLKQTHTIVLGFPQSDTPGPTATLVIDPPLFNPDPVRLTIQKPTLPELSL